MIELIDSIEDCLEKKAYLGALSLALTIPDICGQIEYPEEENVGKRYRKWYDTFIFKYENPIPLENWMVKNRFDGFICYQLRNSIFHSGEVNRYVRDKIKEKYKINGKLQFNLFVSESNPYAADYVGQLQSDDIVDLTMRINVEVFCKKMVANAKWYYKEHKNEFTSENVITNIDF